MSVIESNKRLAVIDDDAELRELVCDIAASCGFAVEQIADPRSCDASLWQEFDVIVLDLMMPGVDGIELMRAMEGQMTASLILMSGLGSKLVASAGQVAADHGLKVSAALQKPFRAAQLREALSQAVRDAEARAAGDKPAKGAAPKISGIELARALANDELVVHFQPQVALDTGCWSGIEALVRWQHPEHGLLYPDAFVYLAEQPVWAGPFTKAVLRKAVAQAKVLQEHAGFAGTLSVNLPPTAMNDLSFPDQVVALLAEEGFAPSGLMLEITETGLPEDEKAALDISTRLHMRGIQLSIDDFGTGYSGLERLRSALSDELKIDLSFVRDALQSPEARSIVESAVALGHKLQMSVVAEGVENRETLDWLRQLGCDVGQGYLISRPVAVDVLCAWATADTGLPSLRPAASAAN